ncbi:MAG: SOS response-associated peptidase [Kofleriaceae bacterium]
MCGRYTLTRNEAIVEDLQASLGMAVQGEWWKPRFNVAPTQPAPVVLLRNGGRTIEMMRWGLIPFWAGRGGKRPPLMINARLESIWSKPMFRDALQRKRCLVPADGFFEWQRDRNRSVPFYVHPEPRRTIAFAGLWARASTEAGEQLSFTIITGPPNELVAPLHDRMPIVVDPSAYATWLDPMVDGQRARALLHVPPVADWRVDQVSPRVNNASNDDPTCIDPEPAHPAQRDLFE